MLLRIKNECFGYNSDNRRKAYFIYNIHVRINITHLPTFHMTLLYTTGSRPFAFANLFLYVTIAHNNIYL